MSIKILPIYKNVLIMEKCCQDNNAFFFFSDNFLVSRTGMKSRSSKMDYIDFSGTTETILKFGTNIGYDFLYCIRKNQHPHIIPFICPFFFSPIKFCIKDFSGTICTTPRNWKFCTNIGNDLLYGERENHHPHAYHSLYLPIFLFLQ